MLAVKSKEELGKSGRFDKPIVTGIEDLLYFIQLKNTTRTTIGRIQSIIKNHEYILDVMRS
ncbi:hypothetical protein BC351_26075 [Paenibacillus ferrarius]|uniref:Uncharacterized protein n=2 Tax=Paenibacillus ferrarius TaxID=1469647 RepID=A0A1V4HKC7_9BACL|nr:hypothetical protein BC351_26075 [Paenibacillus ferrarius]